LVLNQMGILITWTDIARAEHNRDALRSPDALRIPSDLKDREWAVIAPLIPPAKHDGRPRRTAMRAAVEAILSIPSGGCQ
jgi:putative transposase